LTSKRDRITQKPLNVNRTYTFLHSIMIENMTFYSHLYLLGNFGKIEQLRIRTKKE